MVKRKRCSKARQNVIFGLSWLANWILEIIKMHSLTISSKIIWSVSCCTNNIFNSHWQPVKKHYFWWAISYPLLFIYFWKSTEYSLNGFNFISKRWFRFERFFCYQHWRLNIIKKNPQYWFLKRWLRSLSGKFGFVQSFSDEKKRNWISHFRWDTNRHRPQKNCLKK